MSEKTYSKNVKTTNYAFTGTLAGLERKDFTAIATGDTTERDALSVVAFLTRAMRAQLRAEGHDHASLWTVMPDSIAAKVETARYEISDAEFMRIGHKCANRAEAVQYDMTRTISAGSAVMAWTLASAGGTCTVSAQYDPSTLSPAEYLKWYTVAIWSARKQVARTLNKEYGMTEQDAKKMAKLVSPELVEFVAGESGLYGVTFAQLAPYKVEQGEQGEQGENN